MGKFFKERAWYTALLICSTIYVYINKKQIYDFSTLNGYNLIFIVWLFLLLYPLFAEMEILGVKIKKEVQKANSELKENVEKMKEQIIELRIANNINNTIHIEGVLPTKEQLSNLLLEANQKPSKKSESILSNREIQCDEEPVHMFKVRYNIESVLKKLVKKYELSAERIHTPIQAIKFLRDNEYIDGFTSDIAIEIIKIANHSVHGEIISKEYFDFVNKMYPRLMDALNDVLN